MRRWLQVGRLNLASTLGGRTFTSAQAALSALSARLKARPRNTALPSCGSGEFVVLWSGDSSEVVPGGAPRGSAPPLVLTG